MAMRSAIANGNWSSLSTWDNSAVFGIPTASDVVFANGFSVNIDESFIVQVLSNGSYVGLPFTNQSEIVPIMTSNTSPSGICSASANGATAWNAFDNNGSTAWTGVGATGLLSYQTITPNVARSYHIYVGSTTTATPRNWTFEGSNDGSSWTILDTRTGILQSTNAWASYTPTSTGSFTYYRLNVTAINGGTNVTVHEFRPGLWAAAAAGGSFIFNSGSISGSATSTTAALTAGATNLIQVTATTGSVALTAGSDLSTGFNPLILHSGNCDFNLTAVNLRSPQIGFNLINKTSAGTITINANFVPLTSGQNGFTFNSNNGNTIINGNIQAAGGSTQHAVNQSAGNITVVGNVVGGAADGRGINLTGPSSQFTVIGNVTGGTGTNAHGINFTGTSGSVTGTVTGASGNGILSTGVITVTGNVIGGAISGINNTNNTIIIGNITGGTGGAGTATTANAVSITVTGTVTAGSGFPGIFSSGTGTVLLTGNMLNTAGRQAIFAQNLFISDAATTQWRLFTPGGQDKTLYSADTFPNQPSSTNVRSGSLYGPANALSGSMVVPSPSDVRVNVLTDNTVGTGQSLTAADFLAAISASADPFAERLRNVATVDTVGSLVTGLNGGF